MPLWTTHSFAGRMPALLLWALAASLCVLITSATAQNTLFIPDTQGLNTSVVVVALDPSFTPYSSVGEGGQLEGFAVEALQHLGPATGLQFATVPLTKDKAQQGLIDGSVGLAILPREEELQSELEYSQPLCIIEPAVFWRGEAKSSATRLGIIPGDIPHTSMDAGLGGFPIEYSSRSEALVALSQGQLDAVICAGPSGIATINALGLSNIVSTPGLLAPLEYCFAASKQNSAVIAILNTQLVRFNISPQRVALNDRFLSQSINHGWLGSNPWLVWIAYPLLIALAVFASIRLYKLMPVRKKFPKRLSISALRGQQILGVKAAASLLINPSDNTIRNANQAASSLFGYSINQLKSKQLTDLVEKPDKTGPLHLPGGKGTKTSPQQYTCRLPSGETRDVEIHSSPMGLGSEGLVNAMVVDVTGRNLATKQLRTNEGRLAAVFNSTVIGIALINRDGNFIQFNKSWTEMLGYTDQELLSLGVHGVTNQEDRPASQENLHSLFSGQQPSYRTEQRFVFKGNGDLWVEISASPLLDAQGQVEAVVWLAIDIQNSKQGDAERDRLIMELGQAAGEIKTLIGLLPICAYCKKIRDDSGYWQQIEGYIKEHSDADFTHGICPDCAESMYPGLKTTETQS